LIIRYGGAWVGVAKIVRIESLSAILQTGSYSETEAAEGATVYAREGGLVWELEEVTEEE